MEKNYAIAARFNLSVWAGRATGGACRYSYVILCPETLAGAQKTPNWLFPGHIGKNGSYVLILRPQHRTVMGSNKKNASKSKAGCQAAERVVSSDVELKEPEVAAPEVSAVVSETPSAEVPALDVSAEAPSEEVPSAGMPSAEVPSAEVPEAPAEKAPPPPNLSLHASAIPLSLRPEMSVDWPLTRRRQLFNVVYFGLITFQLAALAQTGAMPLLAFGGLFVCGLLAAASVWYLFNHRHHQSSADELSPRARRSFRAAALLVPAFLMFVLVRTEPPLSPYEITSVPVTGVPVIVGDNFTFNGEMALGKDAYKKHRYGEAFQHFQKAALVDPQSDVAAEWIAQTFDSTFDFSNAITMASNAIALNPDNENAHVILGHGYNMTGRFSEAVEVLQKAIALNPEDGEAYGYLARAFSGLGDFNNALIADNSHVKIHWYESRAFEQRADTLDRLGRSAEARYVRELAEKVRQSNHR